MKRGFTLSVALIVASMACFGASLVTPADKTPAPLRATDVRISVGAAGQTVDLKALSTMKAADYEKLSGRKMNLFQRMEFRIAQKRLRRSINSDGTINEKQASMLAREMDGTTGFHLGGFALGFLLLPIGVLIAYLINDEKKANRIKWAWIGLAAGVLIWIILVH
jgi:hypothetical protein